MAHIRRKVHEKLLTSWVLQVNTTWGKTPMLSRILPNQPSPWKKLNDLDMMMGYIIMD
jgi:hypothetical protein